MPPPAERRALRLVVNEVLPVVGRRAGGSMQPKAEPTDSAARPGRAAGRGAGVRYKGGWNRSE